MVKIKGYKESKKVTEQKELITIIDKTKPPAPRYTFKPHPQADEFKTTLLREKYWATERERWIEGYNGLCGAHYQYLSQWKIRVGKGQEIMEPDWRLDDEPIFLALEEAERTLKEFIWFSRRGIGKTGVFAFMAYRQNTMYPSSSQVITSSDKNKIFSIFGEKMVDVIGKKGKAGYLHPAIAPEIENINATKQEMMLALSYPKKGGGTHLGRIWGIETTETPQSPSNISSKRATFIGIDEIGLHTRREEVLGSARPALDTDGKRTGLLIMCGTIEAGIKTESLAKLRKIVESARLKKDSIIHFTPYWAGQNLTNGYPDIEKSKREWEERIEMLERAGDQVELMNFKKNYPPDIETALGIGGVGSLPPDIIAKVAEQSKIIVKEKPPIIKHTLRLDESKPNGIEAVVDNMHGNILILEHPQSDVKYLAGIDPITGNSDNDAEGSNHAVVIYKPTAKSPVAVYAERVTDTDYLYRQTLMLQKYYNESPAMLEINAGALLLDKYKQDGTLKLLADTPKRLSIKLTKTLYNKGYRKLEAIDMFTHDLFVKYLREYTGNIWFADFIDEIPEYLRGNTDIVDAFLALLLFEEEQVRKFKSAPEVKPRTTQKRVPVYDAQGRRRFEWRTVIVSDNNNQE